MLKVESPMVSMRLSDQEKDKFNLFLEAYQKRFNVVFTKNKEFFLHLMNNAEILTDSTDQGDVIVVNTIKDSIKAYADREQLPLTMTTEDVVIHALSEKTPPEKPATEEQPASTEETVNTEETDEQSADENKLIIDLDETQKEALNIVNTNRNKELSANDLPEETLQDTAKGLMFNSATLCNWSGEFYTGIK